MNNIFNLQSFAISYNSKNYLTENMNINQTAYQRYSNVSINNNSQKPSTANQQNYYS